MQYLIDTMKAEDWEQVRSVFLEGIETGNATFEAAAPNWEQWDAGHLQQGRIVVRAGDQVIGWAALSPVSDRCAYSGVAEVSVYVVSRHRGLGVGKILLEVLIECSEKAGIWTLQAGIFPENQASLALVERCGFRRVGTRVKLGKMDGVWRDVVFFERRSEVAGVD
ncbi:GNAT family N-acetyltransferase [Gemmatimonadota bacterium]